MKKKKKNLVLALNTNVTVDPPVNFVFEQELDSTVQMNSEKRCSAYKQSFIGPSRVGLQCSQWNSDIEWTTKLKLEQGIKEAKKRLKDKFLE